MTVGFGLGMFVYSMVCLMIGLTIIYIVLKNLSVTYGGEKVAFFRPNAEGAPPVQTSISLTFQELELITRERIAAGF